MVYFTLPLALTNTHFVEDLQLPPNVKLMTKFESDVKSLVTYVVSIKINHVVKCNVLWTVFWSIILLSSITPSFVFTDCLNSDVIEMKAPAIDSLPKCNEYATKGLCQNNEHVMKRCQASCGVCNGGRLNLVKSIYHFSAKNIIRK